MKRIPDDQAEALMKRAVELSIESSDLEESEACTMLLIAACTILLKDARTHNEAIRRCQGLALILPMAAMAAISWAAL
jgi:hypothetical protein